MDRRNHPSRLYRMDGAPSSPGSSADHPSLKFQCPSLFRSGSICDYVLVKQNRNPASVEIPSARNVRCLEVMMPQGAVSDFFQFIAFQELNAANTRRRPQMIHD